jgi:hypothetical protein
MKRNQYHIKHFYFENLAFNPLQTKKKIHRCHHEITFKLDHLGHKTIT